MGTDFDEGLRDKKCLKLVLKGAWSLMRGQQKKSLKPVLKGARGVSRRKVSQTGLRRGVASSKRWTQQKQKREGVHTAEVSSISLLLEFMSEKSFQKLGWGGDSTLQFSPVKIKNNNNEGQNHTHTPTLKQPSEVSNISLLLEFMQEKSLQRWGGGGDTTLVFTSQGQNHQTRSKPHTYMHTHTHTHTHTKTTLTELTENQ